MLDELGWDAEWAALAAGRTGEPARVRPGGRSAGPLLATATGEVRVHRTGLVTGDWVLLPEPPAEAPAPVPDATGTVVRMPRRTELVRGAGGQAANRQVLAANVDLVFVLVSLAAPPSAGRLDRLLAVAWDSGARPVVVLTKADLAAGTAAAERDEVAEAAWAAPVLLTSTVDGRGLAELRGHAAAGPAPRRCWASPGPASPACSTRWPAAEVARVGELGPDRARAGTPPPPAS